MIRNMIHSSSLQQSQGVSQAQEWIGLLSTSSEGRVVEGEGQTTGGGHDAELRALTAGSDRSG